MGDPGADVVLELRDVQKDYRGLRPLRLRHLQLRRGQSLALLGLDAVAAEVLVNLVTGSTLPDAGEVSVFGRSTADLADADAWLASLDRFGILSARAVLLDELTVEQNLAMPFTLELDPIPDPVRSRVARLAAEVGLEPPDLTRRLVVLSLLSRLRVRLARAVALDPIMVVAEHPNASVSADDVPVFAREYASLVTGRNIASLTLTADPAFAAAVAGDVLTLQPATGELAGSVPLWRRWLR
jgi:ABC-type transporter Mla maintaining outer membrane lipid asymmetry ATPase subunit MlaF